MRRNYDFLDITKFVLSLMVVAIHANPLGEAAGELRFPFVRIAVPVFFLISSFLLFEKVTALDEAGKKRQTIWKFVKRNLQLYFAWFVVLLPITIYVRGYFCAGIATSLKGIAVSFLFGSTFQASWYIMALVIGMLIVWGVSRFLGNGGAIVLGMITYSACCMLSNYRNALDPDSWLVLLANVYPAEIYNSFPVALIWVSLGKWLAEHKAAVVKLPVRGLIVMACISAACLIAEHCLVRAMHWQGANDCYFMLIPVCVVVFLLALNVKADYPSAAKLRRFSTVTYCMHVGLTLVVGAVLRSVLGLEPATFVGGLIMYLLVLSGCTVATVLISWLEKKPVFSFLRYLM